MGARIAAALAAYHPRGGRVILADPPLTGPGRDPYPVPIDPYVDSLRKAKQGATADDMRPAFPTWSDEHLELRALWLGTCSEAAIVETYERFHTEDLHALLPQIERPRAVRVRVGEPGRAGRRPARGAQPAARAPASQRWITPVI